MYEEFERRTSDAFPDLAVVLTAMKSDWIPAGMADMWRDKGIEPSLLNSPKAVKFGFRTTNRGSKSESPNWEYVEHRFATTLTAHYIELARYTGNGRHLLDAARSDAAIGNAARVFTSESLLEAFATFILACGSTLPFWTRVDYLKELVHTVVSLDAEMRGVSSTSTAIAMTSPRRFEQLIGMSTLALLGLDIRTRVVARDIVFEHLTMMPSTPQFFEASVMDSLQPETRVFFLAGLYPPNSSSGSTAKSQHDADIARMDALSEPRKMEEREFWRSLKLYFGRGPRHRGVAIEEFEDAVSSDDFQAVGVALQAVAVLLLRCPAELLQKVGITNLRESADTETPPVIQVLTEAARAVRHGLSKQGDLVQDARIVLGVVRASFQSHLLRCEAPQGTNEVPRSGVSTVLQAFRADCGLVDQVGYLGEDFEWTATRSMIWCKKTRALIRERLENASRVVSELLTAQQTPEFGEGRALQIGVKEQARGVQLCIENHCAGSAPASGTKAVPTFLDAIGGGVTWQTRAQSSTMHWYSVTITVPWIEAIEISN